MVLRFEALSLHVGTLTCSFRCSEVWPVVSSLKLLEDLDWEEEEFALQDFLKNEPAESNCGAQEREMSNSRPEAAGKPPDRCDEEEEKEEEEERDSSTPLSAVLLAAPAVQASVEDDRGEKRKLD